MPPIGTRLIDSVPPAMTMSAKPHMMCSAAEAIACRPDAQKRFIVTADGIDRHAGAQARDARDVQPLLGLRHRAAQDHIVDVGGLDAGRAAQRLADHGRGHLVGPDGPERAVRRLADRGACGRNDYCVLHEKSVSSSSSASPTSLACPSNR